MEKKYQHIYLSPHLDDAVYSCAGSMALQAKKGQNALVITIFAGFLSVHVPFYSFAYRVHRGMGFGPLLSRDARAIVTWRREEDAAVMKYIHADYLWLDYLDAIYRGKPAYYSHLQHLLSGNIHQNDRWIEQQLTRYLFKLHGQFPHATWYAPLGVGNHVDHHLVFAVAQNLSQYGVKMQFYEEFPYATQPGALAKRLQEIGGTSEARSIDISDVIHLRKEVAKRYSSQIKMNFGSVMALHEVIERYTQSVGGVGQVSAERYWQLPVLTTYVPVTDPGFVIPDSTSDNILAIGTHSYDSR